MSATRLRIGARLAAGFGLAVLVVVAVGVAGYIGINNTQRDVEILYAWGIPSLDYLVEADRDLQQLLVAERTLLFNDLTPEILDAQLADYEENLQQSDDRWGKFRALQVGDLYQSRMDDYDRDRASWLEVTRSVLDQRALGTPEGLARAREISLGEGAAAFDQMRERLNVLQEAMLADADAAHLAAEAQHKRTTILMISGVATGMAVSTLMALLITLGITRPLARLTAAADQVARGSLTVGDLGVRSRDELGDLATAFQRMSAAIAAKGEVLARVAQGDLTTEVSLASDEDALGQALSTTVGSLHGLIAQTRVSVEQISAGADQVAQASQSLSQGATEQASSLEEVSSALTEVSGQARQNADNATAASQLARTAVGNAEKGGEQLRGLVTAMESVNAGSREITKIVKLIDDIAFQINLLALNANVEAARAGKYGKGFAVVADEVRNLAVRSATAVRDTTQMVEQTTASIGNSSRVAEGMAGHFGEIVQSVNKVADLLGEIALASREQAEGVAQITTGLGQVDTVTQANSASAEQCAAAAEELSSQVQRLSEHVGRFKVRGRDEVRGRDAEVSAATTPTVASVRPRAATSAPPVGPTGGPAPVATPAAGGGNGRGNGSRHAESSAAVKVDPRLVVRLDDDKFDGF